MAIDSVDKFSTAQDRLETAMDLLKAIEQIADADSSRGIGGSGIRAVARAAADVLTELHELFFENGRAEEAFAAMQADRP
jgi:hypothetical protein